MVASEIRALFAVASRPEIVSLAGGVAGMDLGACGVALLERAAERARGA
jgi:hypothetical protein